jgi:spore maturation protein CgeB
VKIVVFGLAISSAWGNGHATLLRGLFRALHDEGHEVLFFEHDTPYYAAHRDAVSLPYVKIHLYSDWNETVPAIGRTLKDSDVGMVTSYCPDGMEACRLLMDARSKLMTIFYDMDAPVTLERLGRGETVSYIPTEGLAGFDLVLSYTGGRALSELAARLGAKNVTTLYGWVDPEVHHRAPVSREFASDLSYLGTYAVDRQRALEDLLIEPARELSNSSFVVGGAMYPNTEYWPSNIRYFAHVAPPQHAAFYSSSPLTLSVTRGTMASLGYCPSGRLFEAAACGTAVLSDWWEGLDTFFKPGEEILIADSASDTMAVLKSNRDVLAAVGARARERVLDCHTATMRARKLIRLIEDPTSDLEAGDGRNDAMVIATEG